MMRPKLSNAPRSPRPALVALSVLAAALAMSPSASAAKVTLAKPVMIGGVPISKTQGAIQRIEDGGYIAVADSAVVDPDSTARTRYLTEDFRLRAFRVNSMGKIDRRFAKGDLGRGVKNGRAREYWEFQGPFAWRPGVMYFVGNTTGRLFNALSGALQPASAVIAFSINSGNLIQGFGKHGVALTRHRNGTPGYSIEASAVEPIDPQRLIECGVASFSFEHGARAVVREHDMNGTTPLNHSANQTTILEPPAGFKHTACSAMAPAANGTYFLAGYDSADQVDTYGQPAAWVARVGADGAIDSSFGAGGFSRFRAALPAGRDGELRPRFIHATSDGGAVVLGKVNTRTVGSFALHVDTTGAIDPTFGQAGLTTLSKFELKSSLVGADGSLLLGGTHNDTLEPELVRLTANGGLQSDFGSAGIMRFPSLVGEFDQILSEHGGSIRVWGATARRGKTVDPYEPWRVARISTATSTSGPTRRP